MNEDYFRRCWLTLKGATIIQKKTRLRLQMDEIECLVGGVKVSKPSPKKKSEDKNEPDEGPIEPI
ncbi:hypothetical protein LCGC14_2572560 [marine sediment metagenome]|uniref:Uncharacterized protein n=1 Tax=marine sediment metagenome TaxID=412755 RepID=A0A0F9D9N8_9ZZZZ